MTSNLKRRVSTATLPSLVLAFVAGIIVTTLTSTPSAPSIELNSLPESVSSQPAIVQQPRTIVQTKVVPDVSVRNLLKSWSSSSETCGQWFSAQRMSSSYLDAYIIGTQKSATSELSMRISHLNVMRKGMIKEWHFFEKLRAPDHPEYPTQLHREYTGQDLNALRLQHYKSGFPGDADVNADNIPVIDGSLDGNRSIVMDSTVEYMLSERVAYLAHSITPHAKIIMTLREPISRALSQFNMMIRLFNKDRRAQGIEETSATPERFDEVVREEVARIQKCGYDASTGNLEGSMSQLLTCFYNDKHTFNDLLYVTRGLYHVHMNTWMKYYPPNRMMFVPFDDISSGKSETMQDVAKFLCVKPYTEEQLERYRAKGSTMSFGQQAAAQGLDKMGFETYAGNDKYLVEILPSTRKFLEEFYAPANAKLFAMLGRELW